MNNTSGKKPSSYSDSDTKIAKLVKDLKENINEAWDWVVKTWGGILLSCLLRRGIQRHDAEDLLAETLCRFYKKQDEWRTGPELRKYFVIMGCNLATDWLRRQTTQQINLEVPLTGLEADPVPKGPQPYPADNHHIQTSATERLKDPQATREDLHTACATLLGDGDPVENSIHLNVEERMWVALTELTDEDRRILCATFIGNDERKQLAEELGINLKHLRTKIKRLKDKLHRVFEKYSINVDPLDK